MQISRCGNKRDLSWIDALSKSKQPIKDKEAHALSQITAAETTENALHHAAEAVFGIPTPEKSNAEVIQEASVKIQEEKRVRDLVSQVDQIKEKLNTNEVDPVALGVVTEKDWKECQDPGFAEKVAKIAAQKQIQAVRNGWQERALQNRTHQVTFNPESSRQGQIMPSHSVTEDQSAVVSRQLPSNANSIFDPNRLDKMASEQNKHDESIKESRESAKNRQQAAKDWRTEEHVIPDDLQIMKSQAVAKANSFETVETRSRVPSNQISMADDISGKSPEEIREKLSQLFTTRIPDSREEIRQGNRERRESIQRKETSPEEKREWEKVGKPLSTSDLQRKLMELWTGTSE